MISDFQKYKRAKLIVDDLEQVDTIIRLSLMALTFFRKYAPVKQIIQVMLEKRMEIKAHLREQRAILDKKGKIAD